MKSMKQDFRAVVNGLKKLAKVTEKIARQVDRLQKAKPAQKRKTKAKAKSWSKAKKRTTMKKRTPAKKRTTMKKRALKKTRTTKKAAIRKTHTRRPKVSATGKVLNIVKRFKRGISVPALARHCHYNKKKVRDILSKSFAQGKVKRLGRGIYAYA